MVSSSRESGQAAVETALTMPLMVFLALGTLQLFMMLQGRILAEYAAFRSVRVGSTHFGECEPMMDSAVASLLPSYNSFLGQPSGSPGQKFAAAFRARKVRGYRTIPEDFPGFNSGLAPGTPRAIVWMVRDLCRGNNCLSNGSLNTIDEDGDFTGNVFDRAGRQPTRLEMQLIYWFPLRIPFADWVMAHAFAAAQGFQNYTAQNPLLETQTSNWTKESSYTIDTINPMVQAEFMDRLANGQYSWPITASYTMRMMTPARQGSFTPKNCAPTPF